MTPRRQVMLIIETTLAYGRGVLHGVSRYVVSHQPWSLYLDLRELIIDPPAWLDTWQGDGIISRATNAKFAAEIKEKGLPVVDLTDIYGSFGLPHIWTDHDAVGEMAAAHLMERGFRHFAFAGFTGHDWSLRRKRGFAKAIAARGFKCDDFESPWGTTHDHTWEAQQGALAEWISRLRKPVGILAANDMRGQHLLDACRRQELAVPEEVAVIGVDNDELLCGLCDPPLSSVILNPQRVGYEAAAWLDLMMQGRPPESQELLIEPIGVATRQSTDVLAIDDPLVAAALRMIRERACDGLTVDEVLKRVPLSRSMLERRFRKFLGRSPQAEIQLVQLKRVKQLLSETDLTLNRIAELAGYAHPEYMSVVFKRLTSQTPGQYRRTMQPGLSREE